ncbi:MAG TPA: putative peptidoglycan glycosyltransferase FtsW [bacterium]|nr:putative peptidoglycan glycosyltransferase FtsW [bacterium]
MSVRIGENKNIDRSRWKKWQQGIDWYLLGSFLIWVLFGLLILASAGTAVGYELFGDSYYFVKHQLLIGVLPGLLGMYVLSKVDYHYWQQWASVMLFASLLLLVSVFIPGLRAEYGTAHSWIIIAGYSFQPSELVKLTFLIYLSSWLVNRGSGKIKNLQEGLMPFLFILGVIMLLMILQPDVGTMSIIVMTAFVVFFVGGGAWKHLIWMGFLAVFSIMMLINFSPYRAQRLMTFLHPEIDPQGIGYHINQATLAIGSGGFMGRGYGHSRQKFQYLPEVAGDSIFAVMSEELGFVMSVLFLLFLLYVAYRGVLVSYQAPDRFGQLLGVGIISWFIIQAFFNIASMLSLVPMTGVPLPFVSSGGSAMLINLLALGILLNISKQRMKSA